MGTFSRLRYVITANVNALIEKAENPDKLLRSLIREMEEASDEARAAGADLLAEQQQLDRLERQLASTIADWNIRAEKAVMENRDDLARAALKAREETTVRHQAVADEQTLISERVTQLEQDMLTLKSKLAEAKQKLKQLQSRPASATGGIKPSAISASPAEKHLQRALGRFDRLLNQVDNLEARVRSYDLGGPAPEVWNDTTIETRPEIEEELDLLKQRIGRQSAAAVPPQDASENRSES